MVAMAMAAKGGGRPRAAQSRRARLMPDSRTRQYHCSAEQWKSDMSQSARHSNARRRASKSWDREKFQQLHMKTISTAMGGHGWGFTIW